MLHYGILQASTRIEDRWRQYGVRTCSTEILLFVSHSKPSISKLHVHTLFACRIYCSVGREVLQNIFKIWKEIKSVPMPFDSSCEEFEHWAWVLEIWVGVLEFCSEVPGVRIRTRQKQITAGFSSYKISSLTPKNLEEWCTQPATGFLCYPNPNCIIAAGWWELKHVAWGTIEQRLGQFDRYPVTRDTSQSTTPLWRVTVELIEIIQYLPVKIIDPNHRTMDEMRLIIWLDGV
jgi:hypothetical protein